MLNQITKMRLPDGTEAALVDWTDKPLFSSADFHHGFTQQETNLFNYVAGDQVPGQSPAVLARRVATDRDTNISTPGAMASTEEMLVYAIKPEYFQLTRVQPGGFEDAAPTSFEDPMPAVRSLAEFQRNMLLRLIISQKVYAEAGIGYFNTGFGPFSAIAGGGPAVGAARSVSTAGLPSQEAVRSFVIPHHIGGQEKYRIALVNATGNPVNFGLNDSDVNLGGGGGGQNRIFTVRVYLDGLYKRPVS